MAHIHKTSAKSPNESRKTVAYLPGALDIRVHGKVITIYGFESHELILLEVFIFDLGSRFWALKPRKVGCVILLWFVDQR